MLDFSFRRVAPQDFAFCWSTYREAMKPLTAELMQWDDASQQRGIEEALGDEGASILVKWVRAVSRVGSLDKPLGNPVYYRDARTE